MLHANRVVGSHMCALFEEEFRHVQGRCLAQIVCVGLESKPEYSDLFSFQAAKELPRIFY